MFTTEKDAHGFERLVPVETAPTVSAERQPSTFASARMVNGSQDKGKAPMRGVAPLVRVLQLMSKSLAYA